MRRETRRNIDAINKLIDDRTGRDIMSGNAISVTDDNRFCKVRLQGSSRMVRASILAGVSIAPGDNVVCLRLPGTNLWTVLGAYSDGSRIADKALRMDAELAPPNNTTLTPGYGALILSWNCPPQRQLTYYIQVADVGDETNPTNYTTSGGVFYYLCDPGTEKTFRLRAVTEDWRKSAWTDWLTATSGGHIAYGLADDRPSTPIGEYFATDTDELYIGDGENWHTISSGGGGTGVWSVDVAPASPSAYDDEFGDEAYTTALFTEYDISDEQGVAQGGGVIQLTQSANAATHLTGMYQALPDGDFTIACKVKVNQLVFGSTSYVQAGIVLWDDASNSAEDAVIVGPGRRANGGTIVNGVGYSSFTDWDTVAFLSLFSGECYADTWYYIRLRRSGGVYYLDYSEDGLTWVSQTSLAPGTPSHFGFGIYNQSSGTFYATFEFLRYRSVCDSTSDPVYGGSDGSAISHGTLANLDADDHTQYHNDTRGDARYSQLGHTHTESDITDLLHDAVSLQGNDVSSGAPSDGEVLVWSDANSQWEPGSEVIADHDHSGDAGDGGTFDAANLTSGSSNDGDVLTSDGAGGAAWEALAGGAADFTDLGDVPSAYTGEAGNAVIVNATEDGLEFGDAPPPAFTELTDAPSDYTGQAGNAVIVNQTEDGLELGDAPAPDFTDLTDVPADYTGHSGKAVTVKSTEDGLEFSTLAGGVTDFTDLSDTPSSLTADKWLKVNSAGDALEWVDAPVNPVNQALFYFAGTVETGASPMRIYNKTGQSKTISKVFVYGSGATGLVVDIHMDGTTIFTTQTNRPTLTSDEGESTTIEVSTWADGSYLTCEIDTAAGSDVVVHVIYS